MTQFLELKQCGHEIKLCFYPFRGDAALAGTYLRNSYNPDLYMNGFCWNVLFNRYFPDRELLSAIDIMAENERCILVIQNGIALSRYQKKSVMQRASKLIEHMVCHPEVLVDQLKQDEFDDWE